MASSLSRHCEADKVGRSNLTRRVMPSEAKNLRGIAQPVPSAGEGTAPRNDTACRIATLPLVARNDHVTMLNALNIASYSEGFGIYITDVRDGSQ